MAQLGKKIVDDLYVHTSTLYDESLAEHRSKIEDAMRRLPTTAAVPCVAKVNLRTGRVSLLNYPCFDSDPFPVLAESWAFAVGSNGVGVLRDYRNSLNPPILHRKELLVLSTHPLRERWLQLTSHAEDLGLFDDASTIGFKLNWERVIESKGYQLVGEQFVPLGNELAANDDSIDKTTPGLIQRHLTALTRYELSAPIQLLLRHGLLSAEMTLFDYGCGRGGDVAGLIANGITARGWDPHFAAEQPLHEADVVNLGFVVNVIEDPAERVEAIQKAFKLARRVMAVSVMLYGGEQPGQPFKDGFITSRRTFQKYFSQGELKDYLEHVLHHEVFMAGPGVAFVFPDKDCEQLFVSGKYRRHGVAARLLATRPARVRVVPERKERIARLPGVKRPSIGERQLVAARPLLDAMWSTALDLGRMPEPDEVPDRAAIESQLGGLRRAQRLLRTYYDQALLHSAAAARSDDVELYVATQQFSRRPAYRKLEARLQRDVKAFFGDYRTAQAAGLALLRRAADPAELLEASKSAVTEGLGWLEDDHSLQLHVSMVDRLPVVLRAYIACGLMLWDAMSEVQLVKIHIDSGKLTLMEFDDFDSAPIPLLRRRIKVSIRKQDYDVFEYGNAEFPKAPLYRKSRYLHEDYPDYAVQLAFDDALESLGVLDASAEFGPPLETLLEALDRQRMMVKEMRLARSESIPDIDERCGAHFTYRSFVDCGETQGRHQLNNRPLNPASYNALCDLARQILDPVIDYFGGIRLTYGFCSGELGKHISKRVAPKLDQHAACEVGPRKSAICSRMGAACDFVVEDEDMREVAEWIMENLPFDRLYFYGNDRPIHVSIGPQHSRAAYEMIAGPSGVVVPRPFRRAVVGR
ncbi:DNA phosphorothioation-associated putative methyltransferase [Variovorax saccharolyticus]|uniref:DNA phosphorothioation-associated putative methyltransferase n=1 Tax=Variovorax saccharolyticus TaxID=3053516 RepID=UPI002576B43A|nr:DNA phosphorothioation-associated putative methyltransferase [Variovorax sp. J31P216]MDM0025739.1 DNA phosphorothioation-associated putative methyltransferase [Variovorax sp. J31P216]